MQENRQGDLKGCECLHSDCTSLIPGKEKGKGSWEQNCLKVLSNQRTVEQGWGESVNQSWPSEDSHAFQPSTYRHISVLLSSWWRAAPGILCQGADGFQGTSADVLVQRHSLETVVVTTMTPIQCLSPAGYMCTMAGGYMSGPWKRVKINFFCQPDKRQVKVTTELNYETKTILLLGTCIGELSFSSAACWKIKNSKQRGKQMVQRWKQQQKDNLEELK